MKIFIKNFIDVEGVAVFDVEKKPLVLDGKDTFSEGSQTNQWPSQIKLVSESCLATNIVITSLLPPGVV